MESEMIIKALECCTRGRKSKDDMPCLDCPYNECNIVGGTGERQTKGTCQGWLMKDALSLIKELAEDNDKLYCLADDKIQENKRLTEENERLKAVEFTCGFIKPHKVLECPIFDEIVRTKADTARTILSELRKVAFVDATFMGKPNVVTMDDADRIISDILEGNG